MPDEEPGGNITIVDEVGGGSVTINGPPENCSMPATDLSPDVSNHLLTARLGSNQEVTQSMSQGHAFIMEQARMSFMDRQREVGAIEGRATSGVLATPIASPTTQAG